MKAAVFRVEKNRDSTADLRSVYVFPEICVRILTINLTQKRIFSGKEEMDEKSEVWARCYRTITQVFRKD